jgi:hypothetical protein
MEHLDEPIVPYLKIFLRGDVLHIGDDIQIKLRLGAAPINGEKPKKTPFTAKKKCPKCGKVKPLTAYGFRFLKRDCSVRLQSRCRDCKHIVI